VNGASNRHTIQNQKKHTKKRKIFVSCTSHEINKKTKRQKDKKTKRQKEKKAKKLFSYKIDYINW